MIQTKDDNVLIPISIWNELKNDLYFSELIEALEDRQELLESRQDDEECVEFREYDAKRLSDIGDV